MISIQPFKALRPGAELAKQVAARPYDVLTSKEARVETQGNPISFLHVTKSEIDLPEDMDVYAQAVYDKARENLDTFISRNILFRESKPCYYIYELQMQGKSQTGLVCGSSVDDYEKGLIKKHEFTRPDKEQDRINHIKATGAQTGNVFIAYKKVSAIDAVIGEWKNTHNPVYDFIADDAIQHTLWIVNDDEMIGSITRLFRETVPCTYIADGHHRAASAAKLRTALGDGATEGADIFLTTLFPSDQLHIMDYNRLIRDLNGRSVNELLDALKGNFSIAGPFSEAVKPAQVHEFGLYTGGNWYKMNAKAGTWTDDPLGVLDISILQHHFLGPVLGIMDQRTDKRIDFVGGIRGIDELQKRVDSGEMALAISLYPVSIQQLFDIADSGNVMPPKSTWFEPKLRDGLLTHLTDR